ncbi:hypothetical protein M408DRAFT_9897 [Serendipita vermifera MAFF 305830]|uniref:Uncharacterized protein n=1 Tax=Serendipita vermifera MAFF 305830 TaxID=933852 RepID=A0A0C3B4S1_SERVB|nr:hypothetical protein M408DRAFT_9897 [Serendipita vermifera MAFF 305830]
MTCEKLRDTGFLSLLVMRAISEIILLLLLAFLLINRPKIRPIGLYLAMIWLLISYTLYITYRAKECLAGESLGVWTYYESYSLDVDWPPFEYLKWIQFYYCNGYMILGAAFHLLQQLGRQYEPVLGAATRPKRIFDAVLILSGLIGTALQWIFYYGPDTIVGSEEWQKLSLRAFVFAGFNWAVHILLLMNLTVTALLSRGQKGRNKLALKIFVWVGPAMAIYMGFGELAHLVSKSAILLGIREPVLWVAIGRLVMIVRENDLAYRTYLSNLQTEKPPELSV